MLKVLKKIFTDRESGMGEVVGEEVVVVGGRGGIGASVQQPLPIKIFPALIKNCF